MLQMLKKEMAMAFHFHSGNPQWYSWEIEHRRLRIMDTRKLMLMTWTPISSTRLDRSSLPFAIPVLVDRSLNILNLLRWRTKRREEKKRTLNSVAYGSGRYWWTMTTSLFFPICNGRRLLANKARPLPKFEYSLFQKIPAASDHARTVTKTVFARTEGLQPVGLCLGRQFTGRANGSNRTKFKVQNSKFKIRNCSLRGKKERRSLIRNKYHKLK